MTELIDGKVYVFMKDDLETLDACRKVLAKKIKLLAENSEPMTADYTEGYINCIKDTLELLDSVVPVM